MWQYGQRTGSLPRRRPSLTSLRGAGAGGGVPVGLESFFITHLSLNPVKPPTIEGVDRYRRWTHGQQGATVLHALAQVDTDADDATLDGWIQTLLAAGVPLDAESAPIRHSAGIGTALHVAVTLAHVATARARAGAEIHAGDGRIRELIMKPLTYMATYPHRSTVEQTLAHLERAPRVVELARELGYHDADALQAEADDALRAIREALKETPAE